MTPASAQPDIAGGTEPPPPPTAVRRRFDQLMGRKQERERDAARAQQRLGELATYLGITDKVTAAFEVLSDRLFKDLLKVVEDKATIALQEVLDQPLRLRADAQFKRGAASVDFWIEREGHKEDVYKGQGGSVANVLSVALRMFALTTLDPAKHRRVLILDEQDCWLRPDLVPHLVKIIHEAGQALGFQTIMISHHDLATFDRYADKIYQFVPLMGGVVEVREVAKAAPTADAGE